MEKKISFSIYRVSHKKVRFSKNFKELARTLEIIFFKNQNYILVLLIDTHLFQNNSFSYQKLTILWTPLIYIYYNIYLQCTAALEKSWLVAGTLRILSKISWRIPIFVPQEKKHFFLEGTSR